MIFSRGKSRNERIDVLSLKARNTLAALRQKVTDTYWIKGAYQAVQDTGKEAGCFIGLLNCQVGVAAFTGSEDLRSFDLNYDDRAQLEAFTIRSEILNLLESDEFRIKTNWDSIEEWNDDEETSREDILYVIDKALGYNAIEYPQRLDY